MDRQDLERLANFGNSPTEEAVLGSKWWKVFRRRLPNLKLVYDFEWIAAYTRLKFKIEDPQEEICDNVRFLEIDPYQRKSWEIDWLICNLATPHSVTPEFNSQGLRKNNMVLQFIEEHFYRRFAAEIGNFFVETFSNGNEYENKGILVKIAPFLAHSIYYFAINGQSIPAKIEEEKEKREKDSDNKTLGSYSSWELESALSAVGLDYCKISAIVNKTEAERGKILAAEAYHNIVSYPQGGFRGTQPEEKIEELLKKLRKGNLKLADICGSPEEIISAYSNYFNKKLKSICALLTTFSKEGSK